MRYLGGLAIVDQWDPIVYPAGAAWNVPPEWIKAVIQVESSGDPSALNASDPGGSRGLMQISGPTARAYGVQNLDTLFDPVVNVDLGAHLLSDLRQSYGDDFRQVYSAYNSGAPDKWTWSAQVAANVDRALSALQGYAGEVWDTAGAWIGSGSSGAATEESGSWWPWILAAVFIVPKLAAGGFLAHRYYKRRS